MCVIAYIKKDSYIKKDEFYAMFDANPHGGGMAYKLGNKIHIEKGFFDVDTFWEAFNNVKQTLNVDIAIHFRIATSGQITSAYCHPYPLTNNINKMYRISYDADIIVFHNGILHNIHIESGCNDSMTYIKNRLYPLYKADKDFLKDKRNYCNVSNDISGSRLLVMQSNDDTFMLGNGWSEYRNGMFISNRNWVYKMPTTTKYNYNYYWDGDDNEDCYTDEIPTKKTENKRYKSYIDYLMDSCI